MDLCTGNRLSLGLLADPHRPRNSNQRCHVVVNVKDRGHGRRDSRRSLGYGEYFEGGLGLSTKLRHLTAVKYAHLQLLLIAAHAHCNFLMSLLEISVLVDLSRLEDDPSSGNVVWASLVNV
jgi:hypothetical protein